MGYAKRLLKNGLGQSVNPDRQAGLLRRKARHPLRENHEHGEDQKQPEHAERDHT